MWSPDSSAVAFMTTIGLDGGDLMVVDAETGVVTKPDPTVVGEQLLVDP